jgi:hypothetical protein
MSTSSDQIIWSRRLQPSLLRRLYETDARGIHDEALVDEVGFALLARCESIRRVTERLCPRCGGELAGAFDERPDRWVRCKSCEFESTWKAYHQSYKPDRLHGGRAFPAYVDYLREFPTCKTPQRKMLAIDRLIHAVHEEVSRIYTRPAAHNLIAGKNVEVEALLEELAFSDRVSAEQRAVRENYRAKIAETRAPTAEHQAKVNARHNRG